MTERGLLVFQPRYFRPISLRIATNTLDAVLHQYQLDLASLYTKGEIRAIACAVFYDRFGWDASEITINAGLPSISSPS